MKTFSIKELETLSGVKAHTLRMWERRYKAFSPARSLAKTRSYDFDDLNKALQLSLLSKNGFRISRLASLDINKLNEMSSALERVPEKQRKALHELIVCMQLLDTEKFEKTIDSCFDKWDPKSVMQEIIQPFLFKTGLLWKGNRLTEEHFVVSIIRNKIISATEKELGSANAKNTVLLFLPDKGQLDLFLLYAQYMLKARGFSVLYMGSDVSMLNLEAAIQAKRPTGVLTYLTKTSRLDINAVAGIMKKFVPDASLKIAVQHPLRITKNYPANIEWLPAPEALSYLHEEELVLA